MLLTRAGAQEERATQTWSPVGDWRLPAMVLQCTNGHLMCAGCFTHLLADARLRDETATCPNCRTVISRELCSRNLAVEKAVCELPTECQFCSSELPRAQIERHESDLCEERCVPLSPFRVNLDDEQVCLSSVPSGPAES